MTCKRQAKTVYKYNNNNFISCHDLHTSLQPQCQCESIGDEDYSITVTSFILMACGFQARVFFFHTLDIHFRTCNDYGGSVTQNENLIFFYSQCSSVVLLLLNPSFSSLVLLVKESRLKHTISRFLSNFSQDFGRTNQLLGLLGTKFVSFIW